MRKGQAAALFLVLMMSVCLLSACTGTTTQEPVAYGEIRFNTKCMFTARDDVLVSLSTDGLQLGVLPLQFDSYALVQDAEKINRNNITFVTMDIDVENAIITTKWVYYAMLLTNLDQTNTGYIYIISDPSFPECVLSDEYCMEKLHMDIHSYIIDESSSPYYGKSYREAYVENGGDLVVMEKKPLLDYPVISFMNAEDYALYYNCSYGLRIAAMQHYGLINVDELEKRSASFNIEFYRTFIDNDDGEQTEFIYNPLSLNIVGYIETEADKLLSTGVSMDKNSDEYKIVMQQLQNPVFYSLCGNFLE